MGSWEPQEGEQRMLRVGQTPSRWDKGWRVNPPWETSRSFVRGFGAALRKNHT